ncbi:RagB/SusD family nutrient uptake outer membrane protein [Pedobacter sp. MR22-3]|uniref:RagB/SusD family nutrient uptake outer membrane protein n=1 Tax=Pedobacter sp. MR22-3 TaxID=2994552 RepID=UPI00224695CD|nr:RagB/SusD family nutrient uptake outer membrane protein [Pedobacter sp. MR22-3]MCX2586091.1 RagB/SusD family nutrient uptake outer membrane protein [Pedobacter sp. MR22-3]
MKRYQKTMFYPIMGFLILLCFSGCKKYLDEKPDQQLATIETTEDMQALLDYYLKMNFNDPGVANSCTDDYYVTNEVFNARTEQDRNLYLWKAENNFAPLSLHWASSFEEIYICNAILDAIAQNGNRITPLDKVKHIAAQSRFHRARAFLNVIGIWTKAYDPTSAPSDLGIPLRLDADFNKISFRASLAESYNQVLKDLKATIADLPVKDISATRPSKGAAYGLLSRTYLQMRDYVQAGRYADSALQIQKTLMDFNTLNASANFPVAQQNAEVLFDSQAVATATGSQGRALINPELYNLYAANDLRKTIFFRANGNAYIFKGYYAGAASIFNGVATDELLLTRAECLVRQNRITEALADLNLLLLNRYRKGTFSPYTGLTQAALLALIKVERRKELLFRTLRWGDIKRWNAEGDGIVLSRTVNGEKTILEPNSLRYALPLPEDIIALSGMQQNPK